MKKALIIIIGFVILASLSFVGDYYYQINSKGSRVNKEVNFTIDPGTSVKQISQRLYDADLIRSKFFFELYIRLNGLQAKLQAGEYVLFTGQDIKSIAESLQSGKSKIVKVLIKEGQSEAEVATVLEKQGLFTADKFFAVAGKPMSDYRTLSSAQSLPRDFSGEFPFLSDKPKYYGLEGYLFPDTYLILKSATPQQVITKMLGNFDRKLTPAMRQDIAKQGKPIYEIVTMASVVEKEVKSLEDMKIVSGIFWSRIANGQPLQSDATLSYALNDTTSAHTLEELQTESPYNSYKYKGLPPTPIGNPGLNALLAAIYPTETDYNYFLTAKDGRTIFSRTFEEHKRNKAKYLK